MADALKFMLELVDKMSGPANAAAKSIRGLEQALKSVQAVKMPALGDPGPVPGLALKVPEAAAKGGGKRASDPEALAAKAATAAEKLKVREEAAAQKSAERAAAQAAKQQAREEAAAQRSAAMLAKQQAREEAATQKSAERDAIRAAKKAEADKKSQAVAQPHADAAMLPMLAGMPKLRLAEGELEKLKNQLREDKLAVTNLSASLRQLDQASHADLGTMRLVRAELQARKNSLAEVQQRLVLSGNAARFGSEGTNRLTTTLRELAEAAGGAGITSLVPRLQALAGAAQHAHALAGAVGEVGASLAKTAGISPAAATGLVAVGAAAVGTTVAVLALAGGMAALVAKGASLAIEANDAKGDTLDMLEAMLGSAEAARDTYASIKDLTRDTTMTIAQGQELSQSLATAGLTNVSLLKDAMSSIAVVNSVIKGGGDKVQGIIEKATTAGKFDVNVKKLVGTGVQIGDLYAELNKRTGIGVKAMEKSLAAGKVSAEVGIAALTSVIENKLGNVARKQAHDFPVQMARLKENIGLLFEDVNTGPFLESLSKIVEIFDTSTIAGEALHVVITDVFDGLFKAADASIPYVKTLLKGLIIAGLTAAVAFKPLLYQLGLIGPESEKTQPGLKLLKQTMDLIAAGAGLAAEAIVVLVDHAGMLKALGAGVALLILPFAILPSLILGGVAAITYVIAKFGEFVDALGYIKDAVWQAGIGFADGLIGGITSRAQAVVDTVTGIGKKALGGFKSFFGIQSPSRVMMGMGANLSLGVAKGIPLGMPAVNDNMRRMVEIPRPQQPPELSAPRAREQGSGRGMAKIELNFHEGAFQIQGMPGSPEFRVEVTEIFADIADEMARKMGLDPTGT